MSVPRIFGTDSDFPQSAASERLRTIYNVPSNVVPKFADQDIAQDAFTIDNKEVGLIYISNRSASGESTSAPLYYVIFREQLVIGPYINLFAHVTPLTQVIDQLHKTSTLPLLLVPWSEVVRHQSELVYNFYGHGIGALPNVAPKTFIEKQKYSVKGLDDVLPMSLHMQRYSTLLRQTRTRTTQWIVRAAMPDNKITANAADLLAEYSMVPHPIYAWCLEIEWSEKTYWRATVWIRGVIDISAHGEVWLPGPDQYTCSVFHPALWLSLCNATPWPHTVLPMPAFKFLAVPLAQHYPLSTADLQYEDDLLKQLVDNITDVLETKVVGEDRDTMLRKVQHIQQQQQQWQAERQTIEDQIDTIQRQSQQTHASLHSQYLQLSTLRKALTKHQETLINLLAQYSGAAEVLEQIKPDWQRAFRNQEEQFGKMLKQNEEQIQAKIHDYKEAADRSLRTALEQTANHRITLEKLAKTTETLSQLEVRNEAQEQALEKQSEHIKQLERDIMDKQTKETQLTQQISKLQKQIADERRTAQQHSAAIDQLRQEMKSLQEKSNAQLTLQEQQADVSKQQIEQLRAELDRRQQQITDEQAKRTTGEQRIATLEQKLSTTSTELQTCRSTRLELTHDVVKQKKELEQLENELATLKIEYDKAVAARDEAAKQAEAYKQEAVQLRDRVQDLEEVIRRQTEVIDELHENVTRLTQNISDLTREQTQLQQQIRDLTATRDQLSATVDYYKTQYTMLREEMDAISREYLDWAKHARDPVCVDMAIASASPIFRPVSTSAATNVSYSASKETIPFIRFVSAADNDVSYLRDSSIDITARAGAFMRNVIFGPNRYKFAIYVNPSRGFPVFNHPPTQSTSSSSFEDTHITSALPWSTTPTRRPVIVAWKDRYTHDTIDTLYPEGHYTFAMSPTETSTMPFIPNRGFIVIADNRLYGQGGILAYKLIRGNEGMLVQLHAKIPQSSVTIYCRQVDKEGARYHLEFLQLEPHVR